MEFEDKFEYVNCNICEADNYRVKWENTICIEDFEKTKGQFSLSAAHIKHGRIVQCRECGLIYVNPQEKDIELNYEDVEDNIYVNSKEERYITFERDLNGIENYKKEGRLLDVGCSTGLFLEVAEKRGWKTYGLELSKWAVEDANTKGLNVIKSSILDAEFPENYFDVITMFGLIEHIKNPKATIVKARDILKRDGLLYIYTPNIGSITALILGEKWWSIMRRHIYYFSKKTISKILEISGFKIIKIDSHCRTMKLDYLSHSLKPYKTIYKATSHILKNKYLKDKRVNINLGDQMVIFAKKET